MFIKRNYPFLAVSPFCFLFFNLLFILLRSGQNCFQCEFFVRFLLLLLPSLFKSKGASTWGWARTGPAFLARARTLHQGCGSARGCPRRVDRRPGETRTAGARRGQCWAAAGAIGAHFQPETSNTQSPSN